jgi:hypothetical protein
VCPQITTPSLSTTIGTRQPNSLIDRCGYFVDRALRDLAAVTGVRDRLGNRPRAHLQIVRPCTFCDWIRDSFGGCALRSPGEPGPISFYRSKPLDVYWLTFSSLRVRRSSDRAVVSEGRALPLAVSVHIAGPKPISRESSCKPVSEINASSSKFPIHERELSRNVPESSHSVS